MLAGTLDTFSVGEILSLVGRSGGTGALRVWNGTETGTVFCRSGEVTFASVATEGQLGDVLVKAGFVGQSDWTSAAGDPQPTRRLAEALKRSGIETPKVHGYIRHHTEESVFELDRWRDGQLRFDSDDDHVLGDFFSYPTPPLLEAVARRRIEWSEIETKLGSLDRIVAQAPEVAGDDDEVRISKAQLAVLRSVDGQRSARDLSRRLGAGLFQTCSIIAGLVEARLVVMLDAPVAPPMPAPAVTIDAFGDVHSGNGQARPVNGVNGVNGHGVNGNGLNGHDASDQSTAAPSDATGHGALTPEPVGATAVAAPAQPTVGGPAMEFVEPGEGPARDLILRLLSAVKEEL
jgi:hypothetical protein